MAFHYDGVFNWGLLKCVYCDCLKCALGGCLCGMCYVHDAGLHTVQVHTMVCVQVQLDPDSPMYLDPTGVYGTAWWHAVLCSVTGACYECTGPKCDNHDQTIVSHMTAERRCSLVKTSRKGIDMTWY